MRLLLDECVPARLRRAFASHEVSTVVLEGWAGVKNGRLLALAAQRFDALITMRPAAEALPASLRLKVGVRGAQKAPVKERTTIRLSPDVVQRFRATGDGWQTRVDVALQDWLKTHKPTKVGR